jgi:phosphoribosylformylglycinamidine synthase
MGGTYDLTDVHQDLGTALFAEDGARALVSVTAAQKQALEARCAAAGVPLCFIGQTGGDQLEIAGVSGLSVEALAQADASGFERAVGL